MRVLITGGAGFIGSRLAKELLTRNYEVRLLDHFLPQVHGDEAVAEDWLVDSCDLRRADVRDRDAVRSALHGVDAVVHLAAETGPAQSMYEIERYCETNLQGTAVLLQEMLPAKDRIKRLIVASSRAIYGEGKYNCRRCGAVYPDARSDARLSKALWEPVCPICGNEVEAVATDEQSLPKPTSIYAANKLSQEQMCLIFGRAYGIPTRALRYQNVYGPGQSLTNPYIGVLAIFAARIKSGSPVYVYEDGKESRDFVHVRDAVNATVLALEREGDDCRAYNVGSGEATSLFNVAEIISRVMNADAPIEVNGKYRVGDIRHCYADLTDASRELGYQPSVSLEAGLRGLSEWALAEKEFTNDLDKATGELTRLGLFR